MHNVTERPSNTTEQMRAYLQTALLVFEGEEIPEDLREVAFSKLLDWAAAKTLMQSPTVVQGVTLGRG